MTNDCRPTILVPPGVAFYLIKAKKKIHVPFNLQICTDYENNLLIL
jgi:hypothetical protein